MFLRLLFLLLLPQQLMANLPDQMLKDQMSAEFELDDSADLIRDFKADGGPSKSILKNDGELLDPIDEASLVRDFILQGSFLKNDGELLDPIDEASLVRDFVLQGPFLKSDGELLDPIDEASLVRDFVSQGSFDKNSNSPNGSELLKPLVTDEKAFIENFKKQGKVTEPSTIGLVEQELEIDDFKASLEISRTLIDTKRYAEALSHLSSLFLYKLDFHLIYLEIGKTLLRQKRFLEATRELKNAITYRQPEGKFLKELAHLEAELGHMKVSRELFQEALNLQKDYEERWFLDYAGLMLGWGDYYLSEAIISSALMRKPNSKELKLKLADALIAGQRYDEAEEIYRLLLWNEPEEQNLLYKLAYLKSLQKNFSETLACIDALYPDCTDEYRLGLLLKGDILFRQQRYPEALEAYTALALDPVHEVEVSLKIAKTFLKMGIFEMAAPYLIKVEQLDPGNIEARFYLMSAKERMSPKFIKELLLCVHTAQFLSRWADCYMNEDAVEVAITIYKGAVAADHDYYPARWNLAELLAANLQYSEAEAIYLELISEFSENPRLMLERARINSWAKKYQKSIEFYDRFIALNPKNPLPIREKARVSFWGKMADFGMRTYDELLSLTEKLKKPSYNPMYWTFYSPPKMLADFTAERLQKVVALEQKGKWLVWNKAPIASLSVWNELIREMPGNEEALFDYAQTLQSVGKYKEAPEVYKTILKMTPLHNIVKQCIERIELFKRPIHRLSYAYWHEVGYGVLSNIRRYQCREGGEIPIDYQFHVGAFYNAWMERSYLKRRAYYAYGPTLELGGRFSPNLEGSVSYTRKIYTDRKIKSRTLGEAHIWRGFDDYLNVGLGFEKGEEIPNYFAEIQSIRTETPWISFKSNITRQWHAEATYRYCSYSDSNAMHYAHLYQSYQFTEHPSVLKLIGEAEYRNTRHTNIYLFNGTTLIDIIHPYWSPQHYVSGRLTLEFRHDYAPFEFYESEKRYYDIRLMLGTDTDHNPFEALIFAWHIERYERWTFEVEAMIHRSPEWIAEGLWATCQCRF